MFHSEVLPIGQDFESHVDTRNNEKGAIKVVLQFLVAWPFTLLCQVVHLIARITWLMCGREQGEEEIQDRIRIQFGLSFNINRYHNMKLVCRNVNGYIQMSIDLYKK